MMGKEKGEGMTETRWEKLLNSKLGEKQVFLKGDPFTLKMKIHYKKYL